MHDISIIAGLSNLAGTLVIAVGALLPIVDPLGAAPIYLAMTTDLSREERGRMAKAVAVNSFLLLIASTLVGAYVLDFFGVSIPRRRSTAMAHQPQDRTVCASAPSIR